MTFLFTDIEGSTRPWEADPKTIKAPLAAHDDVLLSAVEGSGGWLFTHTGDVVCAAFSAAGDAVAAAIHARRSLELPLRMGIAMGEAELRGDDYFGPAVEDPPSTSQTAPSASSTAVPEDLERIWLPALTEKGAGRSELDGGCDRFR